jgi:hypothetical protein
MTTASAVSSSDTLRSGGKIAEEGLEYQAIPPFFRLIFISMVVRVQSLGRDGLVLRAAIDQRESCVPHSRRSDFVGPMLSFVISR